MDTRRVERVWPIGSRRQAVLAAGLVLLFVGIWVAGVSSFSRAHDYDEGVYLNSARLVSRGEPLFGRVFSSQPPLFLDLLSNSFRWLGDTAAVGRLCVAVFGAVALGVLAWIAWRLIGPAAACPATVAAGSSYLFCWTGHVCEAEMVSLALALLAVAAALAGTGAAPRRWSLLAGACFAAAVFAKILAAPIILPVAVLLASTARAAGDPSRFTFRPITQTLANGGCFVLAGLLTATLLILPHNAEQVYQQAVLFHLAKRVTDADAGALNNAAIIARYLFRDAGVLALAVLGLVALLRLRNRLGAWVALAWLGSAGLFLLIHRPLQPQHVVLLVPALAWLAGASIDGLSRLPAGRRRAALLVVAWSAVLIGVDNRAGGLPLGADWHLNFCLARNCERFVRVPVPADAAAAIALICEHTTESDAVVTDCPWLVFSAGRVTPAPLCDTSFARLDAGWLTAQETVAHARSARMVILWTGRLDRSAVFTAWVKQHYRLLRRFGPGKEVYVLDGPPAEVGGDGVGG